MDVKTKIENYQPPRFITPSNDFSVYVNDEEVYVYSCKVADYVIFSFEGEISVKIKTNKKNLTAIIRPVSLKIDTNYQDGFITFTIKKANNLSIEIPGLPQLYIFANPLEKNVPNPKDPAVIYFKGGQVYDVERLEVESGQTIYIEGGAILKGAIHSIFSENITVRGRGIIDASYMPYHKYRMLVFEKCKNVQLEGIVTTGTPVWNLVLGCCNNVAIDNLKLIGWVVCSDGIDIVGSQQVKIKNCFLRNNDDCIAVKSVSYHERENDSQTDWRRDVRDVVIENCTMYNDQAGNVMEIGFETQSDVIENITFRDIDVIGGHGYGGVFTIHNGDRALIRNIKYEDIRVEHFYDKLIDLRIMNSRYSKDNERGKIRDIYFKDIQTIADQHNCISLVGGFDDTHDIAGITFDNFYIGSKKIRDQDDLQLYTKHAKKIKFL